METEPSEKKTDEVSNFGACGASVKMKFIEN